MGILWMLDLNGPLPAAPLPRLPAAFVHIGPQSAGELAEAMGLDDPAPVLQRLATGRQCYAGRVEGRLATYGWVSFGEEGIGELGLSIHLPEGEAYIWDCVTLPAYRGQRLYPALLAYIVRELQRAGVRRAWVGTDTDNIPSQIGVALAGFQPVLDVVEVDSHLQRSRRSESYGRPGIPEHIVEAARHALFGDEK